MGRLTATKVKSLTEPGRYPDGDGLYLLVGSQSARSWILRAQCNGKRRDIGLGSAKLLGLSDARELAQQTRKQIAKGLDPVAERRRAEQVVPTFREAAIKLHGELAAGWKNGKHQAQWLQTLELYAFPAIGKRLVSDIEGPVLRNVLAPIWLSKPETARRVRQRIGAVLDWAYANGFRQSEAPMRSLSKGLPRQPKQDRHFAALEYEAVPAFLTSLRARESVGRLALEALILTAARSGEIRLARWPELDLETGIWTIPSERMKMGRTHVVPLAPSVVELFKRAKKHRSPASDLVFPGQKRKMPLSDMTLLKVVRDLSVGVTVHGFRSAFRDWVAERTNFPGEVAEAALAHAVQNKVEAAYRRTDYLEKRRELMRLWAQFCAGTPSRERPS